MSSIWGSEQARRFGLNRPNQRDTDMTLTTHNLSSALVEAGPLLQAFDAVWEVLWNQPYIPVATLELCRLRLAQLHDFQSEVAVRYALVGDTKIRNVLDGHYDGSADFTDAELAVLDVTEVYAQDPAAITDDMADRIKLHYGEPGFVCLVEALGFIEGRIRLALMFDSLQAKGV